VGSVKITSNEDIVKLHLIRKIVAEFFAIPIDEFNTDKSVKGTRARILYCYFSYHLTEIRSDSVTEIINMERTAIAYAKKIVEQLLSPPPHPEYQILKEQVLTLSSLIKESILTTSCNVNLLCDEEEGYE
jgi:chromosomal replication initiation ATPase DnaA